ncbi:WSC domain-containing protein [Chaetomium strumarium]|uniref:WSC domain-containing protein n=1 Tax=Chaetomium strumarium TaxID=1170767 RepID=A0AAJ0H333_9PEZI|nr:WSC domain-containing protein [Chaetomium strumarium]
MRLRAGQVVLAGVALLGAVHGQAYYGSVHAELEACDGDNFVRLGCFGGFADAARDYFTFRPQGFDEVKPSHSFPGYDPGSALNNTVTPLDCARACRGFGYKFAALVSATCTCGTQLPDGLSDGGTCDVPCPGDARQTCGGAEDAVVMVDPTYAASDQVPPSPSNPTVAAYYQYLGCFNLDMRHEFPIEDQRATQLVQDIDACFNLCAGMGYPLVHGSAAG